jgi:Zn-dependent M28 family amino/carboxypeptidase/predicted enzyme related to lactoylglutathione lyase
MRNIFLAILFLACPAISAGQQTPVDSHFDGNSWWAHVKFLADDSLEGRDTGSEGLRKAQAYAVEQLQKAGLEPASSSGFYQPVRFNQYEVDEAKSSLALVTNGQAKSLSFADDAFIGTRATHSSVALSAPLVFVGYGLQIPEKNLDELAGLDLKGKIVVYLAGSPSDIPTALASHYQTAGERWKSLRAAGVIGTINIANPASMDIPWSRISVNRNHPSMDLADAEFNETPGQQLGVAFNPASAEQLFTGSGHTFAEIAALGKDRKPLPHFPLAVSLKANAVILTKSLESSNIVAKLPGSDPVLKNEFVVLSAHIDHVGIGAPINGDRIYNGAMDDGSGSALVMDIASSLKAHPEKIQRSILFLLVTAEEKGLLGSKYFAAHPTVPAKAIVADVNVDMFLPIVPLKILKIEGIEESDLGTRAAAIAQSMGIKPIADPEPLRNAFIRSDQYSFIKKGVPAVKVDVGFELGTPEQKIFKDWLTNRYHAPSDDVNQPVDLKAAAGYEEFTRRLLLETANTPERPRWKADSFFRRYAADQISTLDPRRPQMGRAVVHFEIGCQNSAKTQEFYEKLFDWKIESMGPAAMIAAESGGIGGHITALGHEPNHYTMFYVDVDDVAAYLEKAKALGGKTFVPPVEIPTGTFAWMQDPEGNTVGLWKAKK